MAKTRAQLVWAALLAFTLRALIPLGFMPAGDGSLSLVICPGGLALQLLQGRSMDRAMSRGMHRNMDQGMGKSLPISGGTRMPEPLHRGHGLMGDGYCTFTTGCSSAPPPLLLAALVLLLSLVAAVAAVMSAPCGIRVVYLPQARAPPAP